MYSNTSNDSDLGEHQCAVWCKLNPEIDPARWAYLCRCLGHLTPKEFHQISYHIRYKRLTSLITKQILNLLGIMEKQSNKIPIISIGPSGIGGQYQQEMTDQALMNRAKGTRHKE